MMSTKVIVAVAIVAVLAVTVTAAAVMNNNGGEDKLPTEGIEITDSLGNKIVVDKTAEKVCIVNSNQAKFFQMFNLEDKMAGACQGVFDEPTLKDGFLDNATNLGKYNSSGVVEKIVETKVKYVLTPTSMGITAANQTLLKDTYGITCIVLECYGSTMLQDAEQIVKLFSSDSGNKILKEYKELYNSVKNSVLEKASAAKVDKSFLAHVAMKGNAFYTDNSELAKNIKSVAGHNSLNEWYTSIDTSETYARPNAESVAQQSQSVGIDRLILRSSSSDASLNATATKFISGFLNEYASSMKTINDGGVYVIHTDITSGCRDFIGFVAFAEIFGIDTGYDMVKMINDFNQKYEFKGTYSELLLHYTAA